MNERSYRRPLVAGNWKMHLDLYGARKLAQEVVRKTSRARHCDVLVAPPFPFLEPVGRLILDSPVGLCAQDVSPEEDGAFTGDVSTNMLVSVGCSHVIVGHSERRQYHLETDDIIARKVKKCLEAGLVPVLCVGERLQEREAGQTFSRVGTQVEVALEGMDAGEAQRVVIAYEPVWAIGTGRTASPAQAQEVHEFIRKLIQGMFDYETAQCIRILYGGSVKPDNARPLLAMPDIDGALVGGASLNAESFSRILFASREV